MAETTGEAIQRHERWLQEQEEALSRHRVWLEEHDAAMKAHETAMRRAEARMDRMERLGLRRLGALEAQVRMLADRQLTTQASLDGLIKQIDRFLRGQSGNGSDRG